jgi:tRNA threonylcarbamoyladenosine biosynthesis protein TsaE
MRWKVNSRNVDITAKLAKLFAVNAKPGMVFLLSGELGSGKTTFVQHMAVELGVKEKVNSPTFNIVKCYSSGKFEICHIDGYRLEGINQDLGLDEYINEATLVLIEWSQFLEYLKPKEYINLEFANLGSTKREINISSKGEPYHQLLQEVKTAWATN